MKKNRQLVEIFASCDEAELRKEIKNLKRAIAKFEEGDDVEVLYEAAWKLAELL